MKANEFMIVGDWVINKKWIEKPFKITRINDSGKYYYGITEEDSQVGPFLVEELEPILLTAEILEKNRFENDFYEEESIADYHTIRLEGYSLKHNIGKIDGYLVTWCNGSLNVTTDFHGCVQKEITYVHELQHCFKLVGVEKDIVL